MGKLLSDVVDVYVHHKKESLRLAENDPNAEEVMEALQEKVSQGIAKEIVHERQQIILSEAKKKIDEEWKRIDEERKTIVRQREENHIRELKVLLWEGFFIAFIVGLLVNQATDIISIFKGVLEQKHIGSTSLIILILLLICVLLFSMEYLKKLVAFFKCSQEDN